MCDACILQAFFIALKEVGKGEKGRKKELQERQSQT